MRTYIILFLLLFLQGCSSVSLGNSRVGFDTVEGVAIQPADAVEIARPFLDESYRLRIESSSLPRDTEKVSIWVSLRGSYYFIVKESYPAKELSFYLDNAVRVHKQTGEIIEPK